MNDMYISDSTIYINEAQNATQGNERPWRTFSASFTRSFDRAANSANTTNLVKTAVTIIATMVAIAALIHSLSAVSTCESAQPKNTEMECYNANTRTYSQGLRIGIAGGATVGILLGGGLEKINTILSRNPVTVSIGDLCNQYFGIAIGALWGIYFFPLYKGLTA